MSNAKGPITESNGLNQPYAVPQLPPQSSEKQGPGLTNTPSETRHQEDEDLLMRRAVQFLNWAQRGVPGIFALAEEVQVARLAIEIARLRSSRLAREHITEAAQLLTLARVERDKEMARHQKGDALTREEVTGLIEQWSESQRVPFDKLYRPGKREGGTAEQDAFEEFKITRGRPGQEPTESLFRWKVFQSQKGLRKLIQKHFDDIYSAAATDILKQLPKSKSKQQVIAEYIRRENLCLVAADEKKLTAIRSAEEATAFIRDWGMRSPQTLSESVWEDAKNGRLGVDLVYALWRTREAQKKARAKKVAQVVGNPQIRSKNSTARKRRNK
jgi:hypothetical protein